MGMKSKVRSRAFRAGIRDGLDWDLSGFETSVDLAGAFTGWDDATISALGSSERFLASMGLGGLSPRLFTEACRAYNKGAHRGATLQDFRRQPCPRCGSSNTVQLDPAPSMRGVGVDVGLECRACGETSF